MYQTNTQIMQGVAYTDAKRIANNTVRYIAPDGDVVYRLHNTDIVRKHADGSFTLNSGGWRTPTTKDRLNTYAPVRIFAHKGMWRLSSGALFYDGMRVDAAGQLIGEPAKDVAGETKAIKAKIKRYCALVDSVATLPMPGAGDCWLCSMFHAEKPADPKARGHMRCSPPETGNDTDHLMSHMEESYLHGSILVNAMRWAGYQDTGIGLHYQMNYRDTFKRTLRRYLNRKFGLA